MDEMGKQFAITTYSVIIGGKSTEKGFDWKTTTLDLPERLMDRPLGCGLVLDGWPLVSAIRYLCELVGVNASALKNLPDSEFGPAGMDCPTMILERGSPLSPMFPLRAEDTLRSALSRLGVKPTADYSLWPTDASLPDCNRAEAAVSGDNLFFSERYDNSMTTLTTTQVYPEILHFTLNWEGGFADNPKDPGGATMRGITQSTYDHYRKDKHLPLRTVRDIAEAEVSDIYATRYWHASSADELHPALAAVHFDSAVQWGVFNACKFLQDIIGVDVDGDIGPQTRARLKIVDQKKVALKYADYRMNKRHQRVRQAPTQIIFLKGWLRRDQALKTLAQQLITRFP